MIRLVDCDEKVLDLKAFEPKVARMSDVAVRETISRCVRVVADVRSVCASATKSATDLAKRTSRDSPTTQIGRAHV